MKDLTLIIPAKNEINCIDFVLSGLEKNKYNNFQILIVVDNKNDNTLNIDLQRYKLNAKFFITNKKGFSDAIIDGVLQADTKFVCVFNADGSFDPNDLEIMYDHLQNNDFVFCSRYQKNGKSDDDTTLTKFGNYIFTLLGKILFKCKITDILYFYFMTTRQNLINMNLNSKAYCIALEIPLKASINNMKIKCIPSHERRRYGGKKKVREFVDGFKLLFFMLSFFLKRN